MNERRLVGLWRHFFKKEASVVLMRHAPKYGSDSSGLSKEGRLFAQKYGCVLARANYLKDITFVDTDKQRTTDTLNLMFNISGGAMRFNDLNSPRISSFVQRQVEDLHMKVGRFRNYFLNHTYYFLERLGGEYDAEHLHKVVALRMATGIIKLFEFEQNLVVYCGHSPSIEVGCEKLLGKNLSEIGGFLNPLDSIHLKKTNNQIEFVGRINPILGYVDLESENY
ncbi:hypothetical protein ACFLZC_00585 [Patescibacteria group bacterium]